MSDVASGIAVGAEMNETYRPWLLTAQFNELASCPNYKLDYQALNIIWMLYWIFSRSELAGRLTNNDLFNFSLADTVDIIHATLLTG